MGEAKRRKASGHDPNALAKRLVAAWNGDGDEFEGDVFDAVMAGRNPDGVFLAAMNLVPDEDRADFAADMYDDASALDPLIRMADGTEMPGRLQLFCIAVHGPDTHINSLLTSREAFQELTRQIKGCGFAAGESNVVLVPLAVDPVSAATAGPADVRRIAKALLHATTGERTDFADTVRRILDVRPSNPAPASCQVTVVDRLLIGARLLLVEDGQDLFDPAAGGDCEDEESDDGMMVRHETARVDARCRFMDGMMKLADRHDLMLMGDGPASWAEGLGMLAIHRAKGHLAIEAAQLGISLDDADEAHVFGDDDAMHVAVRVGGKMLGPVDMPMELAGHALEEIAEWLTTDFKQIVAHKSMSTLKAACGMAMAN